MTCADSSSGLQASLSVWPASPLYHARLLWSGWLLTLELEVVNVVLCDNECTLLKPVILVELAHFATQHYYLDISYRNQSMVVRHELKIEMGHKCVVPLQKEAVKAYFLTIFEVFAILWILISLKLINNVDWRSSQNSRATSLPVAGRFHFFYHVSSPISL